MKARCVDASVIVKLALKGERHRATARRLVRTGFYDGFQVALDRGTQVGHRLFEAIPKGGNRQILGCPVPHPILEPKPAQDRYGHAGNVCFLVPGHKLGTLP